MCAKHLGLRGIRVHREMLICKSASALPDQVMLYTLPLYPALPRFVGANIKDRSARKRYVESVSPTATRVRVLWLIRSNDVREKRKALSDATLTCLPGFS